MNNNSPYAINPLYVSFSYLKALLPGTLGKNLPAAEELARRNNGVLFSHETTNLIITVFTDGFFLWRDQRRVMVSAVDRIKKLHFRDADGDVRVRSVSEYLNGPCLVPLLMFGDAEAERDPADYEIYWLEFKSSIDA